MIHFLNPIYTSKKNKTKQKNKRHILLALNFFIIQILLNTSVFKSFWNATPKVEFHYKTSMVAEEWKEEKSLFRHLQYVFRRTEAPSSKPLKG